jgi:predicted MPP superfamily phosphohydrolase
MIWNEAAQMHFSSGWVLTFVAIFSMNGFLLLHWLLVDFKTRRFAKSLICALVNVLVALPFFIYFVRFFGGWDYAPYMIPLSYIAGFYLCFSIYASGVFLVTDVFRGVRGIFRAVKRRQGDGSCVPAHRRTQEPSLCLRGLPRLLKPRFAMGVAVVCAVCAFAAFYAPQHITITKYDVEIARRDSDLTRLRAVFLSDTHIGAAVRDREIDEIVARVNAAKPDIVLLGGDIIDEGTPESLKRFMAERFARFKSAYGTYYILGNHDDYRGDTEAVLSLFREAGVYCLVDESVLIDGKFYLIGRADNPMYRQPFSALEAEVGENLPAIVLDHRPRVGETRLSHVVDLQLSGHTHDGQIFPFHLIDPLGLFSLNYGRYERGEMQVIVSSGAGEYAVPVRFGSPAEILVLDISLS